MKIMQGDVEVSKKTHDAKSSIEKERLETNAQQKHLRKTIDSEIKRVKEEEKKKLENIKV